MKDKLGELFKNKNNLIVILLCGVLLLVIALPVESGKKSTGQKSGISDSSSDTISSENGSDRESSVYDSQDYCTYMEQKLAEALSQMDGAGKVRVVIAMKSSEEKIVEKDQPISRSGTAETDSQGGTRDTSTVDSGETTVYSTSGSVSEPYVVKVMQPEVEGVIVLAEGAGTGNVSRNISEAVQVLFGIEAHKIKVVKMETP